MIEDVRATPDGEATIWSFLYTGPGVDVFMSEVSCGCAFIDAGVNYQSAKELFDAAAQAGSTCSGVVTAACKDTGALSSAVANACVAGVDWIGNQAKQGVQDVKNATTSFGECVSGQEDAVPADQYYADWFAGYEDKAARSLAVDPAFNWMTTPFLNPAMGSSYQNYGNDWIEGCKEYFDNHKFSAANAQQVCDTLSQRFDAQAHAGAARYKAKIDLKSLWNAKYKSQFSAKWKALCGSADPCGSFLDHAVGGYKDWTNDGPWQYDAWGILGAALKVLPAANDPEAAIQLGYLASTPALAKIAASGRSLAEYASDTYGVLPSPCPPSIPFNTCRATIDAMQTQCEASVAVAAADPNATASSLIAATAKCRPAAGAYVHQAWVTYLETAIQGLIKNCPQGYYAAKCKEEIEKGAKPFRDQLAHAAKPCCDFGPDPEPGAAAAALMKGWPLNWIAAAKMQDAFFHKWAGQCPNSGPVAAAQSANRCEGPLRDAFEQCEPRPLPASLKPKAKETLASLSSSAAQAQSAHGQRAAKSAQTIHGAPYAELTAAGPRPARSGAAAPSAESHDLRRLPPSPCLTGAPGCISPHAATPGPQSGPAYQAPAGTQTMHAALSLGLTASAPNPPRSGTASLPPSPCNASLTGCAPATDHRASLGVTPKRDSPRESLARLRCEWVPARSAFRCESNEGYNACLSIRDQDPAIKNCERAR